MLWKAPLKTFLAVFSPISRASWQTSHFQQEFSFQRNRLSPLTRFPKPITPCSFIAQLIIPEPGSCEAPLSAPLSVIQREEEDDDERLGESVFDETGGSGNEEIRLARQGLGRRSVERVCVGHHWQICQLAVNGFPILELNYAICLLGLVLPLFERFKLHKAQWVSTISFYYYYFFSRDDVQKGGFF